ncbi:phosphoribosylanthranilate isomerase [Anaerotignum propionicum]|uniref:phosphoribosylanthranilate isomerase n=1 Tax=Anaerotignum propionicum TaxID=28446 RepID=UPI00210B7C98|nr:phosphoribosylanthranilate isomerase [Anaerotignum propionicum]MCQ4937005.1 phosphoribosylanthranilate isomerase [Anaerotignum propionicum]
MNIKICGLRREEDMIMANLYKPNFIGFVFYPPSARYVTPEKAAQLKGMLDLGISAVGVFVNEEISMIESLCSQGVIDMIQLHGDEDEDYILRLKEVVKNPIIKAVRVKNAGEILAAAKLPCEYLLLDTYREYNYGGSGETFDHGVIPPIRKPYFLAGGLNASNMGRAARACKPFAFDVSSGCETDGYKDDRKFMGVVALAKLL